MQLLDWIVRGRRSIRGTLLALGCGPIAARADVVGGASRTNVEQSIAKKAPMGNELFCSAAGQTKAEPGAHRSVVNIKCP
jgi:hypothetical protein